MRKRNQFQKKESSLEESKSPHKDLESKDSGEQETRPFANDVASLLRFIESANELEEIHLSG